ncbi:hypothetical protein ISN44_As11g031070 [Arabidopsis suecica]|uniref:DUF4283 domain-containing protein n=1 Tax=Arabidopsis suecica TaxID=45249 RepID=A0A8T1ZG60_ARASU|nr:hypothetical protein ISN44_As11g031070 [Arabidopsis suecica]
MGTGDAGDFRVLKLWDQDATLMDIVGKGQPPGDPPDGSVSWVTKVKGTNAGGILTPENLLDDEFVSSRLCVKFSNGEDAEPVITIEKAFGSYLTAQAWSPDFDPLRDDIVTTPVWVRLSNVPLNFYHKLVMMGIARGLGKPIKVALTTLNFERARFARVCVKVNLMKPLKGIVMINGESDKSVVHMGDGLTVVKKSGRRSATLARQGGVADGNSGENLGKNLKEIPPNKEFTNIAISIRFRGLENDTNPSKIREVAISTGVDKENTHILNQQRMGKTDMHAQERALVNGPKKNKNVFTSVVKEKWAGNSRPAETYVTRQNGPKMKHKQNMPARSLICGLAHGEIGLSESGKRLRVEKDSIERQGGENVELGLEEDPSNRECGWFHQEMGWRPQRRSRLPRDMVSFIKDLAKEVSLANVQEGIRTRGAARIDKLIAWKLSRDDWIKLNIDGASRGVCSAPLAEIWGVYYGLYIAWEGRITRLELKVDSDMVAGFLTTGISDAHPLSFLVRLCYGFLSRD